MKKLQHKSSEQRLLEQREQGFSLYLNGANASLQLPLLRCHTKKVTDKQKRNTKTAGMILHLLFLLPWSPIIAMYDRFW